MSDLGPIFSNKDNYQPGSIERYYISKELYKNSVNNFFVELGAGNGIVQSNTKTLEDRYGWKGVLIEGNSTLFEDLKINRPNCSLHNEVVWCKDSETVTFKDIKFRENIPNSKFLGHSQIVSDSSNHFSIKKQTKTLSSILKEAGSPTTIDFMVVDVEDSFYEVLQGLNFAEYKVKFISVEMKLTNKNTIHAINLLLDNNFRLVKCTNVGPDFYFINNNE